MQPHLEAVESDRRPLVEWCWTAELQNGRWISEGSVVAHRAEELERGYQAHEPNMIYIGVGPAYDSVREDPRFQDLLRRMKLPI
jgi:hypothetical protein